MTENFFASLRMYRKSCCTNHLLRYRRSNSKFCKYLGIHSQLQLAIFRLNLNRNANNLCDFSLFHI